jgi:hypothetical protein
VRDGLGVVLSSLKRQAPSQPGAAAQGPGAGMFRLNSQVAAEQEIGVCEITVLKLQSTLEKIEFGMAWLQFAGRSKIPLRGRIILLAPVEVATPDQQFSVAGLLLNFNIQQLDLREQFRMAPCW